MASATLFLLSLTCDARQGGQLKSNSRKYVGKALAKVIGTERCNVLLKKMLGPALLQCLRWNECSVFGWEQKWPDGLSNWTAPHDFWERRCLHLFIIHDSSHHVNMRYTVYKRALELLNVFKFRSFGSRHTSKIFLGYGTGWDFRTERAIFLIFLHDTEEHVSRPVLYASIVHGIKL